jgi:hypothetical protein
MVEFHACGAEVIPYDSERCSAVIASSTSNTASSLEQMQRIDFLDGVESVALRR